MHLWHLHPVIVHFPIALLLTGCGLRVLNHFTKQASLTFTVRILLALGVLGLAGAVASGLLAYHTAPHVPDAWELQADHKQLGLSSLGVGVILLGWSLSRGAAFDPPAWAEWVELGLWLLLAILIVATGYHGGQLVFNYGTGVVK